MQKLKDLIEKSVLEKSKANFVALVKTEGVSVICLEHSQTK